MKILLLGGTGEARHLADLLAHDPGVEVVSSLAGRTLDARLPTGEVRQGGFGGVEGLISWLSLHQVDAVVDATHPFAATMTTHATTACHHLNLPHLVLRRPGWTEAEGDRWHRTPTTEAAANLLPTLGTRAFLTTGRQGLSAFAPAAQAPTPSQTTPLARSTVCGAAHASTPPAARTSPPTAQPAVPPAASGAVRASTSTGAGVWMLARCVDPPSPVPTWCELLLDRGPYELAGELELMRKHRIDVLVTKDSGGDMTSAKLTAARQLGVPVVVIERPPLPADVTVVSHVDHVAEWLREHR